ncbi:MAG: hypothetical protein QF357_09125, partial [Dehalococcoidia bacterium]|nr:hypothetical protein [Dehalococcoidia bacterium]
DCDCTKSQGYWKKQLKEKTIEKGNGDFTEEELLVLLSIVDFGSSVFNWPAGTPADVLAAARNVFDPPKSNNRGGNGNDSKSANSNSNSNSNNRSRGKGKKKGHDKDSAPDPESITDLSKFEEKALSQTLAAWLNFAKGSIQWGELIDTNGKKAGGEMTFGDLIAEVEMLLSLENPTKADLERAKDLAEAVNLHDKDNPECDTHSGSSSRGSDSGSASSSGGGRGR